ncbi:MAG: M56 family metallopeptidase, partial [Planctomycetota bacterium]
MSESFNEVGPRMIATFGHSIWQGAVITLIALAVICLFGKRSAELRYRILFVALTMTALLVPVTYCVLAPHGQSPIASAAGEQERGRLERLGTPSPRGPLDTGLSSSEVVPEANSLAPAQTSQWLLAIYALGVSLMCLRLAIGFSRTAGYVQRASAVNQPVVEELLERLWPMTGLRRKPFVGVCHRVASPVLVGLLRPAFLLPPSLLTNLSPTELESILLHELAHLYRRDHWAQLVQRLIEALLFFNPAIWFLSRNLSVERELCCDDLAIRWGTEPCDLAEALVSAAAIRKPQAIEVGSLVLAATGERPSTLARRVRRLLGVPADQHRIIVPRYLFALFIPLLLVLVATASQIGDDEQSTNVAAVESRETVALTTTDEAVPQQPANSETRVSKQDRDRDDASSTDVVEPSRAVFRLSGNVIDSRGTAIPNATLAIWGLGGVSSMTGTTTKLYQADAQGEFRIEFPMPQINDKVWPIAWVYAPGHAMAVFSLRLDDKDIELEGISVQLNEPEVSRHRIVGPKGKPVTNALVYPEYVSVRGFQLNDNTLAAAGPKSFIARLP